MAESSKHEEARDAQATNEQTLPERRTHRARGGRRHRRLQRRRAITATATIKRPVNGNETWGRDREREGQVEDEAGNIKQKQP